MVLGLVAEVDGSVSCLHATGDLGNREIDVPERHGGNADKPIAVSTGPVRHPIVEGPHALLDHLGFTHLHEVGVTETADIGVEHLGKYALIVHELESFVTVVHRRMDLVEGIGNLQGHEAVKACHRIETGLPQTVAVAHPYVLSVDTFHMGDLVVHRGRGSRRPHVGWFGYMGIDVNDIEAFEEICGAHDYKNRTTEAANAIPAEITPKGTRVRLANNANRTLFSLEGDGNEVPESEASGPAPR